MILSVALALFFMIGAVSAVNETDVENQLETSEPFTEDEVQDILTESSQETLKEDSPITTTIRSDNETIMNGEEFSVKLKDSKSSPIVNKSVEFNINDETTNATTDDNGVAKVKIDLKPGYYAVKYSFSAEGYTGSQNSTELLVISSSASNIKSSDYIAYIGVVNTYTVKLTAGDVALANRTVTFKINGKTYSKKTNANGKASININEAKGKYTLTYSYDGEDKINPTSGKSTITVKKGVPTKIGKYYSKIYRNKKAGYFKIKLVDVRGNPIASKKVAFKVNGKKYTKKTNSKGIATIKIKLKIGKYKVKVKFAKTSKYNAATKTYKITVKAKHPTKNGMWLFGRDMKSVNFKKLKKYGFTQVFLNFKALELYGKSGVEKWIKEAKSYGVKVHLWMQVFYGGGKWQNPVKNGKINYNLINSKVKEAKKYAKVKGVAGVHFDYVRYPGTAHKYPNAVKAVNTFIKKATTAVHKINKKLVVSAAVMPEPSSMKQYYGQDIRTMGKYLDAIIPMVYKGNYNAGTKWIKWVTETFKKQSSKAKIWTGLQSYRSDAKLNKIPAKELMGDCDAAANGGATGIILFRFGLFNFINFNEV